MCARRAVVGTADHARGGSARKLPVKANDLYWLRQPWRARMRVT